MSDLYDAVVIGAGQAGLATGYHLKQAGVRFAILEAGQPRLLLRGHVRAEQLPGRISEQHTKARKMWFTGREAAILETINAGRTFR